MPPDYTCVVKNFYTEPTSPYTTSVYAIAGKNTFNANEFDFEIDPKLKSDSKTVSHSYGKELILPGSSCSRDNKQDTCRFSGLVSCLFYGNDFVVPETIPSFVATKSMLVRTPRFQSIWWKMYHTLSNGNSMENPSTDGMSAPMACTGHRRVCQFAQIVKTAGVAMTFTVLAYVPLHMVEKPVKNVSSGSPEGWGCRWVGWGLGVEVYMITNYHRQSRQEVYIHRGKNLTISVVL
ncbi:hypothetical protein BSL78_01828 [Apostichopus japonicus]|uniref:Uncharacterized protein n=1 Tax=Stichopus japonicus TaxID=307972 RepID=A0A2G8LLZ5_STIJA|nr:hypothetical protein BSL78_01828 [Apostichopus japonicus]